MDKIEILSPVGEMQDFYSAIESGANAVFLGLNKFNARMKAENINVENLAELVTFAHIKNVKVYVTLNTLLKFSEFKEIEELVHKCLLARVDAFIVQDFGLVYYLKNRFPNIVLHGSTQMGVHNVRGARVAKQMGLSRVVLSREVTLSDIRKIKESVDIELEVFVQGAMCVAFSGNCYMSSLKFNASGNRGECKQLCRLPYTLNDGRKSITGYAISPRDNCMIPYLNELISIGVSSLKIEGRLRSNNYISKATEIYRNATDEIYKFGKVQDEKLKIESLKNIFSRGDFISGYFDGNDIINVQTNNHLGKLIGKVISCTKFKDLYKITIQTNHKLKKGDGIKFVSSNNIISMGIGNVDIVKTMQVVYGKNYIDNDSNVYISLDTEKSGIDYSKQKDISFKFVGRVGEPSQLTISDGENIVSVTGEVCQVPQNKSLTKEIISQQICKVDKKLFNVNDVNIDIDEIYLSLSDINSLRRKLIDEYLKLFTSNEIMVNNKTIEIDNCDVTYSNLAIVDEDYSFDKTGYDNLILSPKVFSVDVISKFLSKYKKYFSDKLIIDLPVIALNKDIEIIDNVVKIFKDECVFMANNIYGLDYLSDGISIFAGIGLNISNEYSLTYLKDMGVKEFVSSIEKWCPTIPNTYKLVGDRTPLMYFAHCPIKTLYKNDCSSCKFGGKLKLKGNDDFYISRQKIHNCIFTLYNRKNTKSDYKYKIIDEREDV